MFIRNLHKIYYGVLNKNDFYRPIRIGTIKRFGHIEVGVGFWKKYVTGRGL